MLKRFVIVGAGNVAQHFANSLSSSGFEIIQVYSRTELSAKSLASKYNCSFTTEINNISDEADIYLFMLSDTGIIEKVKSFPHKNKIMLHTSGSISVDIFKDLTDNYGVFYPFQTFRKEISVDFKKTPICIEASNQSIEKVLRELSAKLGCESYYMNSEKRQALHVAAVFACNFMNHSVHLGEHLLDKYNIPRELLKPLLEQSFSNILSYSASKSQTGPAIRKDDKIIKSHLNLLKDDELLVKLYETITQSIIEKNHKS